MSNKKLIGAVATIIAAVAASGSYQSLAAACHWTLHEVEDALPVKWRIVIINDAIHEAEGEARGSQRSRCEILVQLDRAKQEGQRLAKRAAAEAEIQQRARSLLAQPGQFFEVGNNRVSRSDVIEDKRCRDSADSSLLEQIQTNSALVATLEKRADDFQHAINDRAVAIARLKARRDTVAASYAVAKIAADAVSQGDADGKGNTAGVTRANELLDHLDADAQVLAQASQMPLGRIDWGTPNDPALLEKLRAAGATASAPGDDGH